MFIRPGGEAEVGSQDRLGKAGGREPDVGGLLGAVGGLRRAEMGVRAGRHRPPAFAHSRPSSIHSSTHSFTEKSCAHAFTARVSG